MEKLIKIIRTVLGESKEKYAITTADIKRAEYHKIESFLYLASDRKMTDDNILHQLKILQMKAIKKDAVQLSELKEVISLFETNAIDCLPLKGSKMKEYYPYSFLRFMGDIDILIHDYDMEKAVALLKEKDYVPERDSYNHLALEKLPYMEIELHRKLLPYNQKGEKLLENIWNRVYLREGFSHVYEMKKEDFLIFMLIHLDKHYSRSGTGIRSFLDIYLYLQKNEDIDLKSIYASFDDVELRDRCIRYIEFSQRLFRLQPLTGEYEKMSNKVKNSGVFGSKKVQMETDLENSDNKVITFIFKKAFPPKETIIQRYPKVKKYKILFPFFYAFHIIKICLFSPFKSIRRIADIYKYKKMR